MTLSAGTQEATVARQQKQIETLPTEPGKVSAQLELGKIRPANGQTNR